MTGALTTILASSLTYVLTIVKPYVLIIGMRLMHYHRRRWVLTMLGQLVPRHGGKRFWVVSGWSRELNESTWRATRRLPASGQ